jgi:hypothetical protein
LAGLKAKNENYDGTFESIGINKVKERKKKGNNIIIFIFDSA